MVNAPTRTTKCPNCGDRATRTIYDIGSGPELSCASCEWCWGADGQLLKPIMYRDVVEQIGFDPMERLHASAKEKGLVKHIPPNAK